MRRKKLKTLILVIAFSSATFAAGWYFGNEGYAVEVESSPAKIEIVNRRTVQTPQNLDFGIFWKAWEILNTRHVDRPLDPQKLLYGALRGLAEAVDDPYTAFLPPPENKEVKDNLNGRYEGIGAELGMRNDQLTIISPLDGSPAEAVGVQPGDLILKVDDTSTAELSLSEAVSRIRGPAGTTVVLTLLRPSGASSSAKASEDRSEGQALKRSDDGGDREPFPVEIVRRQITIKSISWEDLSTSLEAGKGDGVIYIRVARFGEQTNKDWDQAVSEILASSLQPPASVILDVRSNSGGYLQASIHIASEFTNTGVIVYEEFGPPEAGKSRQEFKSDHRGRLTQIPVVVLINEGSASASEILAASLKDLKGSQLVGKQSFGKGTVQDAVDFTDGSAVHVTIARWLTPKGENVDEVGLEPDVEVERTEEEVGAGIDSQLEKALEIAKTMR